MCAATAGEQRLRHSEYVPRGRDLARWGQMCLDDGSVEGQAVVPADFLKGVRAGHRQKIDPKEFMNQDFGLTPLEGTAYRDYFWFRGPHSDTFEAVGGFGQAVNVNFHWKTVIVCFSSWMASDEISALDRQQPMVLREIARLVGERLG
jgi:CubicO group peptidase (beta-lactamase class C family)